jgi:aminoglycoside phosphotransferase (APT) family kinase protein
VFDAEQLARQAEGHLGDGVRIEGLDPLAGGSSRELWSFDAVLPAGERLPLVLRRDPEGREDPEGRVREWEALRAAHTHGVPVPEPLWQDTGEIVMRRVEGEAIPRRVLRDHAAVHARLLDQLAEAAARTHAVPLAELPGVPAPDTPPALAAVDELEGQLDATGESHPALELGLRWLRAHLPAPRAPALVHGDFRLGNFLVSGEGLSAVLDWELCHIGDPIEDLGWLCIRSWRFGNDDRPAAGLGSRARLLEAYEEAGGGDIDPADLRFWEVFGNVRWGVICIVQAGVHLAGERPSLELAAIGRRTCEPEWDLLAMLDQDAAAPR